MSTDWNIRERATQTQFKDRCYTWTTLMFEMSAQSISRYEYRPKSQFILPYECLEIRSRFHIQKEQGIVE